MGINLNAKWQQSAFKVIRGASEICINRHIKANFTTMNLKGVKDRPVVVDSKDVERARSILLGKR